MKIRDKKRCEEIRKGRCCELRKKLLMSMLHNGEAEYSELHLHLGKFSEAADNNL